MKKIYNLEDLDCAHCASKIEENISKIEEVSFVSVNFMTQKIIIEAEDSAFDDVLKKVKKIIKKIEPDCRIII